MKDINICVVGLGIIGGSICLALKRAGYRADGWNRSAPAIKYATENNIIDGTADDFLKYDMVFVALPPRACVDFINNTSFKSGAIVSDICGVKSPIERGIKNDGIRYVGCHPMAGKEVSGIENACADLFDYASMVICVDEKTDESAAETVENLAADMGFAHIVRCRAEIHDRKIAYTSQLAHIVSNAYVKDEEIDCCLGFTGGSFQDMTRIAGVDEKMWTELYLENSENILQKISALVGSLEEIYAAIDEKNAQKLEEILRRGRKLYEGRKNSVQNSEIFVKKIR